MAQRLDLQTLLETFTPHVYFQPPTNSQMVYPCILYTLDDIKIIRADNKPYSSTREYLVTVVDKDPDSALPGMVSALPMCEFARFYITENLNHFAFTLFF